MNQKDGESFLDLTKEWYRNEFINQELLTGHRQIEHELDFYTAIAEGNIEYVENNCDAKVFMNPEGMGKLSENALRNIRYHFVVTVAMITRYCVYAGMEQEKAYSQSDFYILKMDKCKTIEEIQILHDKMCIDICKQMLEIKRSQILSKPIVRCLDYIYSHLHYKITMKETAKYLDLSEGYLSRLFRKEMGIAFSDYVTELKIDRTKNMLRFSDYSISEIAYYFAFSSESYFIQTFQKVVGMTPQKYRKRYFRNGMEFDKK